MVSGAISWRTVTRLLLSAGLATWPTVVRSQNNPPPVTRIQIGSDEENYLRYLQTLGLIGVQQWSLRPFTSAELRALSPGTEGHPWDRTSWLSARRTRREPLEFGFLPAEASFWHNSAFPYGMNDGPVWVARGLTGSLAFGAVGRVGPIELTIAPRAFWTQNQAFPLRPIANPSVSPFADPVYFGSVDRPQRFGDSPIGRIDPGESGVSVTALGITTGLSTANGWWGPMGEFPYIISNNAPGFPHIFLGTARPTEVGIGRMHARVLYASIAQSAFSPVVSGTGRRFAGGMMLVYEPRWLPGLELGMGRFYHVEWPEAGITTEYFTHLFESLLKDDITSVFVPQPDAAHTSLDNQLASLFARWVLPRSGFEFYGEFGREDHNTDVRDMLMEPDHSSSFGLGARKVWLLDQSRRMRGVRLEIMNYGASSLGRHRSQSGIYTNGGARQGHTSRGQLLGAAVAVGSGTAATIMTETFDARSISRYGLSRLVVFDHGEDVDDTNVQWVGRVERRRLVTPRLSIEAGVHGVLELNRHSTRDEFNLRLSVGTSWRP